MCVSVSVSVPVPVPVPVPVFLIRFLLRFFFFFQKSKILFPAPIRNGLAFLLPLLMDIFFFFSDLYRMLTFQTPRTGVRDEMKSD